MFSYYGSKSKIVGCYPHPKHDKIIEPFAGSARYSLEYFEKDVLLVDKYKTIIKVWHYLQEASERDILTLPRLKKGDCVDDYDLPEAAKYFLGFLVARGVESPRRFVSSFVEDITPALKRVASSLFKIKHWEIKLDDYNNIDNQNATWFIDPPYQFGGEYYKESNKNIDYRELAGWCKNRKGQIIVCENSKAIWLPFKQMTVQNGSKYKTIEVIWSNQQTNYDHEQLSFEGLST